MEVLIVEDDASIANLIKMSLADVGYECTCAFDGAAGADYIENKSFDLIILDIMLPEIDGYELLEYVKPIGTPVIFLTAKSGVNDRIKGGKPVELTVKEFNLLVELVRNKNIALYRDKLYEKVWGEPYMGNTRTLDSHIQRLRRKLQWEDHIKTVFRIGYRLEDGK